MTTHIYRPFILGFVKSCHYSCFGVSLLLVSNDLLCLCYHSSVVRLVDNEKYLHVYLISCF
jgi:hypothetical protein